MKITSLRDLDTETHQIEDTIRTSCIRKLENVQLTGRNSHYPNCLLYTNMTLINPYDERVMSLKKDTFYDTNEWDISAIDVTLTEETNPVFFFIYNVDNYYHFIYDTLPILYSYRKLKETVPTLKLLCNTSYPSKKTYSPFVLEFLKELGITDVITADKSINYTTMYISSSFTHGGMSNMPPSLPAYSIWNSVIGAQLSTPKRFYVSRRSWIHGNTENIGTNYTMRRKCMNEDALVELLKKYDIQEVFTELLTTQEKIAYFKNAELVVGVVGGGMCNLLFSPPSTKAVCITTPYFLEINERFKYSMDHTTIVYSNCTTHSDTNRFKLFSRVRITNQEHNYYGYIGEVEEHTNTQVLLTLSGNDIAGFSQDFHLKKVWVSERDLEALDNGLNSPYTCNLEYLERDLIKIL
jgi:hypothetical protein